MNFLLFHCLRQLPQIRHHHHIQLWGSASSFYSFLSMGMPLVPLDSRLHKCILPELRNTCNVHISHYNCTCTGISTKAKYILNLP